MFIYTENKVEYVWLTQEVLNWLQENNLAIAPDKYELHQKQVGLLGYLIIGKGVSMSEDTIDTILQWVISESVKKVQSFLGFVNFYQYFIERFSNMRHILILLTQKTNESFDWKQNPWHQIASDTLKKHFTEVPIL